MDYKLLLQEHVESGADITLGTVPVSRRDAPGFGIMHSDKARRVIRFEEKPKEAELLDVLKMPPELLTELGRGAQEELYQASMGIYVFNRQVLIDALANDTADFGKHVIPAAIENKKIHVYVFQDYWEDIGTIRAFFEANLDLASPVPKYSFFDRDAPIYTRPRFLPGSKINGAVIRHAVVSDGCIITDAQIDKCIVGIRSVINEGTEIRETVLMEQIFIKPIAARHRASAAGCRRSESAANASLIEQSSIKTCASATEWSLLRTGSPTNSTIREAVITFAMELS